MLKRLLHLLTLLLFAGIQTITSQNNTDERLFSQLDSLEGEEFRKSVAIVLDSISRIPDYQSKKAYVNSIFTITAQKDEIAHIQSLVHTARLTGSSSKKLFDKAYQIAFKHNRIDDMCLVEHARGLHYIAEKKFDSAMIHILRYRDMTPEDTKGEGYRNIINLLGDIYYYAGLYNQARDIYFNLYTQYKTDNIWNFYRPYVMMNNLGQIALYSGDMSEAKKWFIQSLERADQYLHTSYRNNTMAYTRIKLAETELESGNLDSARMLLDEVDKYPETTLHEDVFQEYLFCKTKMLLAQGKANEAFNTAHLLKPSDSVSFNQYRFIPDIYLLLSDIYLQQNDSALAFTHLQKYQKISDSLHKSENIAQSMIILANRNHELTRNELKSTKQRNRTLYGGLVVLLTVLLIVLFQYRSLYRSKLKLVRKSMENIGGFDLPELKKEAEQLQNHTNETDLQEQRKLINRLREYMESQKPYLDPGLNIQETAKQLTTNRTYLSRAINTQLGTTFPNFINNYRIQEAIRLITTGFTKNHTQEALAKRSGFASRTVFTSAFKKITGVVPSFFIAKYKDVEREG
ncbi:MAG: helix-turn-helix domain-containing protein [Bacteroidetes bacterium]|nr:helix-turn-helix domain-containing protein [Bacteroidota bacterium]